MFGEGRLYKKMYYELYGDVADVIEILERAAKSGESSEAVLKAKDMLIKAELETEELYISKGKRDK